MTEPGKRAIVVRADGPYKVEGSIPLVHKTQVVTEHGEPITWRRDGIIPTDETYFLCRCGQSSDKPFCDGTHRAIDFDGAETAETFSTTERRTEVEDCHGLVVRKDPYLCMESGFCGTRHGGIESMGPATSETETRSLVIAMVERCPSGSYTYAMAEGEPDIEPDLPAQVAVTVEVTAEGPIRGPLWVTGGIPVERADGKPFEARNRVTLCNCGKSTIKPLCDGTHRHEPVYLVDATS